MIPIYKDMTVHTDEVLKKTYELFEQYRIQKDIGDYEEQTTHFGYK